MGGVRIFQTLGAKGREQRKKNKGGRGGRERGKWGQEKILAIFSLRIELRPSLPKVKYRIRGVSSFPFGPHVLVQMCVYIFIQRVCFVGCSVRCFFFFSSGVCGS